MWQGLEPLGLHLGHDALVTPLRETRHRAADTSEFIFMSLRCCEAQDENVCEGSLTTMVHRNETWVFFLGHTIPEMESESTAHLPKCVSVLFGSLGVNHEKAYVGSKIEIHSHGNSVFRYQASRLHYKHTAKPFVKNFSVLPVFSVVVVVGGCYDFFSFFFFLKGARGLPNSRV